MTATNPAKAAILIQLPGTVTLDAREEFIEKARELGSCTPGANQRDMLLSWEAPDLWLLRGLLEDARRDLAEFFDYREPLGEAIDNATELRVDGPWHQCDVRCGQGCISSDSDYVGPPRQPATNLTEMRYWVES